MTASHSARRALVAAVAALAVAGACRRRPVAAPTPVDPAQSLDEAARQRQRDSVDAAERARAAREAADRAAREAADRSAAGGDREAASARSTLLATVYFDYDAAELRDDTRDALEAKLPIMRRFPDVRVRVAGHTDDRGADEYNLALGQRRAASVKRYFVEQGIDGARVEIVSFGKERPTCEQQDEACWSRNRRAEFEVTAGAGALGGAGGR
jgi:peptidoglycan-associated lipoprotein